MKIKNEIIVTQNQLINVQFLKLEHRFLIHFLFLVSNHNLPFLIIFIIFVYRNQHSLYIISPIQCFIKIIISNEYLFEYNLENYVQLPLCQDLRLFFAPNKIEVLLSMGQTVTDSDNECVQVLIVIYLSLQLAT